MRVAVVGSGPSGLFAATELLRDPATLAVDVLERLPVPFGLIRYGVAPDHHKIKSLTRTLSRVFDDPRVRFLGNVAIGDTVALDDLRAAYDAVIVATGAPTAKRLGIPGETLPGAYAAGDLVSWYNAHPYARASWACTGSAVAIVGAGNVALDVARVLLKAGEGLDQTDIPEAVGASLDRHRPATVHIVARRGAGDVRFSTLELLELEKLEGVDLVVDPADLPDEPAADNTARVRGEIFQRWSGGARGAGRRLRFHFSRVPEAVLGDDAVTGLRLRRPDGAVEDLAVQAVVRAVGSRSEPLPGAPFDDERGTVPHDGGRVGPGLYVTGWIKRGATGVVGTNKACAAATVATLTADLAGRAPADPRARDALLARWEADADPSRRPVTWTGWRAIDEAEVALGVSRGRPRTKICDPRRLVEIAATTHTPQPQESR